MVPSTENKISINALTQKKDYWARKLIAEFPNKTWTLSGLSYAYEKSRPQINLEDRREGRGTKRTMSTRENQFRNWFSAKKVSRYRSINA